MGTLKILRKMLQSRCLLGPCSLGSQGGGAGHDPLPQQTFNHPGWLISNSSKLIGRMSTSAQPFFLISLRLKESQS